MEEMRILILGGYGMLGHKLFLFLQRSHEVFATCRSIKAEWPWSLIPPDKLYPGVVAEDVRSLNGVLDAVDPEVVINCIGIIKQRKEANDPIDSIRINSLFPHLLARKVKGRTRVIHFSTDCVFSGLNGMYTEDDPPDAQDLYGRTKILGDLTDEGCLTIRSSIIGRELGTSNGLVGWFLSQRGGTVDGFTNAIYSGFSTLEMARIVELLLKEHRQLEGVWHIASTPISKFDLLDLINERMDLGVRINPDDSVRCDRSLNGERFARLTGYRSPDWTQMVDEMIADFDVYEPKSTKKVMV